MAQGGIDQPAQIGRLPIGRAELVAGKLLVLLGHSGERVAFDNSPFGFRLPLGRSRVAAFRGFMERDSRRLPRSGQRDRSER
jgi:hypothetical protein